MKIKIPAIKILRSCASTTGLLELHDIVIKTAVQSDCNKMYFARNCCMKAGIPEDNNALAIDDLINLDGLDEFLGFADECYKTADYIFKGATPWIIKYLFDPRLSHDHEKVIIRSRKNSEDIVFQWRTELAVYLVKELDNLKYFV